MAISQPAKAAIGVSKAMKINRRKLAMTVVAKKMKGEANGVMKAYENSLRRHQ
jgi:hypothetical protein